MELERERMKEVWCRMGKEQAALLDARDGMLKLTAKGTTELWRLKARMEGQLKDFEKRICAANSEDTQSRERREEAARSEEVARRRPSSNREHAASPNIERAGHCPNKEATPATVGGAGCWARVSGLCKRYGGPVLGPGVGISHGPGDNRGEREETRRID